MKNPTISTYAISGIQARGYVDIKQVPAASMTVVLNGVTYTAATTAQLASTGFPETTIYFYVGDTPCETARNLSMAINAEIASYGMIHSSREPIRELFAMYYGNRVLVVATVPGAAGNAITLAVGASSDAAFAVSGSTLVGGSGGGISLTTTSTSLIGNATTSIAASGSLSIPANGVAGATRKSVIITNTDAANSLEVWSTESTPQRVATVFATQILQLDISDAITIKNETASAIAMRVCEIYV